MVTIENGAAAIGNGQREKVNLDRGNYFKDSDLIIATDCDGYWGVYSYPQSQDHKETKISDIGVGYCLPK
jgi:hypothetical protein